MVTGGDLVEKVEVAVTIVETYREVCRIKVTCYKMMQSQHNALMEDSILMERTNTSVEFDEADEDDLDARPCRIYLVSSRKIGRSFRLLVSEGNLLILSSL